MIAEDIELTEQEKQWFLQLYERGLISGKTLLKKVGIDPEQEVTVKRSDDSYIALQRIEQARRNVEALSRLASYADKVKVEEALKLNIKIMNEVENL